MRNENDLPRPLVALDTVRSRLSVQRIQQLNHPSTPVIGKMK